MPVCEELASEWLDLLADQRSSGLSVKEWCNSRGLSENRYYYWRKRLSESSGVSGSSSVAKGAAWLAVRNPHDRAADPRTARVRQPDCDQPADLVLHIGRISIDVSSGFDPFLLTSVLSILEARC